MTGQRGQLGMAMFLLSEAVFFFLLILAFVYFRIAGAGNLNLGAGALDTAGLLASVFSMWRATAGDRRWLAPIAGDQASGLTIVGAPLSGERYFLPPSPGDIAR